MRSDRLAYGYADLALFDPAMLDVAMADAPRASAGRLAAPSIETTPRPSPRPPASTAVAARRGMMFVLVVSIAAHVALFALPVVLNRAPHAPPPERSVEVELVQDKPVPKAEPKPQPKPEAKQPEANKDEPKPLETKPPEPKPPEIKAPEIKAPEAKPPEPPKEAANPPEPPPVKPPPSQAAVKPLVPPAPEPPAKDAAELEALRKELADLDAEKQALLAEQRKAAAEVRDAPQGATASTFKPLALGKTSDDGEDSESYETLVFSQIEKAKGNDVYRGPPAAVNVRFAVDDHGGIERIEVTTSSGHPEIDAKALGIVRAAAPFPKPPKGAQRTFTSGVSFGDVSQLLGLGRR